MNREIKFRAYDYDTKKMYHDINITFTTWGKILVELDFGDPSLDYCLPNCTISQYTGLKDKNGKEIYEGDIIKIFSHHNLLAQVTIPGIYELLWTGESTVIEIIGNIYENPELLDKDK